MKIRDLFFTPKSFVVGVLLFASWSFADQSPIKIREFKYYREVMTKRGSFLVNKKNFEITAVRGESIVKFDNLNGEKKFSFNKVSDGISHYIYYKNRRTGIRSLGYIQELRRKNFKSEICESQDFVPSLATIKKQVEVVVSSELAQKIKSLNILKLFDTESCKNIKPEHFEEFKDVLISALTVKRGDLARCLNSKTTQEIIQNDSGLSQNASEVLARYLALINSIADGNSDLSLKCHMEKGEENKVASFSRNPLVISLNFINNKFNLGIQDINSSVNHELFHMGMEQFKIGEKTKDQAQQQCLDEKFVELFENVCSYNPEDGDVKPPSSAKLVENCLLGKNTVIAKIDPSVQDKGDNHVGTSAQTTLAAVAAQPGSNIQQNQAITATLVSVVNERAITFEPVPDSEIKSVVTSIATTSGRSISSYEGDGEYHSVVADSVFSQVVQRIQQNIDNSTDSANRLLTNALGSTGALVAAAAVGSRVLASTSGSSRAVLPMTSTEIFADRYFPETPVVQKIVNDPKLTSLSYQKKEEYFCSLDPICKSVGGGVSSASSNTLTGPSSNTGARGTSPVVGGAGQVWSVSKGSSGLTGAVARSVASRSVASVYSGGVSVSAGDGTSHEMDGGDSGRANTTRSGREYTASFGRPIKLDNQIIQRLTSFSKVNEPAYTRVIERFKDAVFIKQMDARKILIFNERGDPLWKSSTRPERCFENNETNKVLKQVSCQ